MKRIFQGIRVTSTKIVRTVEQTKQKIRDRNRLKKQIKLLLHEVKLCNMGNRVVMTHCLLTLFHDMVIARNTSAENHDEFSSKFNSLCRELYNETQIHPNKVPWMTTKNYPFHEVIELTEKLKNRPIYKIFTRAVVEANDILLKAKKKNSLYEELFAITNRLEPVLHLTRYKELAKKELTHNIAEEYVKLKPEDITVDKIKIIIQNHVKELSHIYEFSNENFEQLYLVLTRVLELKGQKTRPKEIIEKLRQNTPNSPTVLSEYQGELDIIRKACAAMKGQL